MCASEQWTAGNFWTVDEAGALRHLVAWTPGDKGPQSVLAEDAALPSWLNAGPVWIGDVGRSGEPTAKGAPESWNTGVVIPIKSGSEIIGVLDFYAPKIAAPEPQFLRVLRLAAAEIGHFYQRALAMERLRESEERFSSTMKLAAIGIAHVDDDGRFLYANPQLCEMLGYSERELLGLTAKQISHPGDVAASDDLHARLRSGAISSFKLEKRYLRKDGTPVWCGLTIAMKRNRAGVPLYDISVVEDISARKRAEERIQYLATHDGLTGLPNRAMFGQLLEPRGRDGRRYERKFAVLFIDLDRFKIDQRHARSRRGRRAAARGGGAAARARCAPSDDVARLGGDEFVVLVQEVSDVGQVRHGRARTCSRAVMTPFVILGQECRVTASIGVCMHPEDGQDDADADEERRHGDVPRQGAGQEQLSVLSRPR